ncbi:MAG: FtsX-like permease family protein [Acidobacteria bacterium]|nr:FtsX-like permease family protein [Acidobacteriota bacterium]
MTRATRYMAERLYRLALLAFPARMRVHYGEEMCADFTVAYSRRRELSAQAGRRFAARAWVDTVRAGLGSRIGGSGVGDPGGHDRSSARVAREWLWLELGSDVRFAARSLRKEPAFAVTVIVVLALGVGINGALSGALQAVFLAAPPFPEPEQIVVVDLALQEHDSEEPPATIPWSYPKYQILAETDNLAADLVAAYARRTVTLTGHGAAQRFTVEVVTRDYFGVLGLPVPGAGALGAGEVILTDLTSRQIFGELDPVGETLTLNGRPMNVVGVAPQGFRGLTGRAHMWLSTDAVTSVIDPNLMANTDGHWLVGIGRLAPDRSVEELSAQLRAVGDGVEETYAWLDPTARQVGSVREFVAARKNPLAQQAVGLVGSAGALVLLIACANLAVLMHARVRGRYREIAVRIALGSSRLRVARALIVEALLLAALAGTLGVTIAAAASQAISTAWPASFVNGMWNVQFVDSNSLSFGLNSALVTFGLAALAGVLFSLLPVIRVSRADVGDAMRNGDRTNTDAAGGARWLVAAEVAIALILTVGAGLMIASMAHLSDVPLGFDDGNLLVAGYSLARGSAEAENPARFHDEFMRRVRALPGVASATLECGAPLDGHCWITRVRRAGDREYAEGEQAMIGVHIVDEEHFATLGIPIIAGRGFTTEDGAETPAVAVINEAAAAEFYPDGSVLGEPIAAGVGLTSEGKTAMIVGIVGDVLYDSPAEGVMPELYVLHRQESGRSTDLVVRTAGEPMALLPQLRAELKAMAPDVPLTGARTVESIGARQVGDTTAVMRLLTAFAALAVLLSATGVWGTVAQAVGQRRREMGIRLALGAQAAQVVRHSLRFGLVWAAAGAGAGLLGAYYVSRWMAAFLFEVTPTDTLAYASSALLLIAISVIASYLPARRAGQVDPVQTLRAD